MVKFSDGVIVKLKSGSPSMTVASNRVLDDGEVLVSCYWYDYQINTNKHASFPETVLELVTDDDGPTSFVMG